jgi:protein arginine N-methyltransferase 1
MDAEGSLHSATRLTLVPGIRTRLDANGHVLVDTPVGTVVDAGPDGFAILAMFADTRTLGDAVAQLRERPDMMPAASVLMSLIETGSLIDAAGLGMRHGWADPVEHARMLHDHRRTGSYLEAIQASVRPSDVVLDIGTGSGILAVAAALAGARRVYAIEASDIASVAARVFDDNGVSDRITLIQGWSTDVDLPEQASLLVSEIIGSEPFEEDILETTLDARRRLLTPDATLIPSALRLFAQPLAAPRHERWARTLDREAVEDWRDRYGIELEALLAAQPTHPVHWPAEGSDVAAWEPLGPREELLRVDLDTFDSTEVDATTELTTESSGIVDAILITFSATLGATTELQQRPRPDEHSSWSTSLWFLRERIDVRPGSRLRVGYRRRVPGQADGVTCVPADATTSRRPAST